MNLCAPSTVPSPTAVDEALSRAVSHLRSRRDTYFVTGEPGIFTLHQLATFIERLSADLGKRDETVMRRLWSLFGVAGAWDDAQGDPDLGLQVFELLDALRRPA